METPILYSFRRCPYAMRARLAIASTGFQVELREILLRDKPSEMLEVSPKATVPILVLPGGEVLEESREIMLHVLQLNDPEKLLPNNEANRVATKDIIAKFDGPFKRALDRTKYSVRYTDCDPLEERRKASKILEEIETRLFENSGCLLGKRYQFVDLAVLPFVRQFAFIDRSWFDAQNWPNVVLWLDDFVTSMRFLSIMDKYPQWSPGQDPIRFPYDN